MTYRELYEKGRSTLRDAGVPEADLDARILLETVCGTNRNDLLVHGDKEISSAEESKYLQWLEKRSKRIPLQHITGVQNFMGLDFKVNEYTLIPRQDTEILVEEVLRNLHDGMSILDMCTGSGCILISLLHYSNNCRGVGVDISEEALKVAKENGERLLVPPQSMSDDMHLSVGEQQITWLHSDLFEQVSGEYEFIVSNPPYIRSDVIGTLMPEVKEHEPLSALDGTADGLYFYREITAKCREYLKNGGMLYFEIGHDQAEDVSSLLADNGFCDINVVKDYAGLDRVVYGTYIK